MAEDSVRVPGSAVPGLLGYPSGNPVPRSTVSASSCSSTLQSPCHWSWQRREVVDWRSTCCRTFTRGPAAIWDQTVLCRGAVLCVVGL